MKISSKLTIVCLGIAFQFGQIAYANQPLIIVDQGSFMAGGTVIQQPGKFDEKQPMNSQGQTLHGDHAYVFYQKPVNAHHNAMIFLHGYGQSAKSWETTVDGREGFQNIFLRKGYSVYLVDQPRRGRAGRASVAGNVSAKPDDQLWFNNFRMGEWPNFYPNVKFPRDQESLAQFFHQMTPDTASIDNQVVADAMVKVIDKAGDSILMTHSAGGGPGWETAIRNNKVKAVIALEPGTFPFPEQEMPAVEKTSSPFPAKGMPVSQQDFLKLTKIPIVVYFGDNIPTKYSEHYGLDNWRVRLNLAKKWQVVMKKYGGDVEIVELPKIGITGNTHFMMSDLNNQEVADAIEHWLASKGLNQ